MPKITKVRIAAMADLHIGKMTPVNFPEIFATLAKEADFFVICGDLTDHGSIGEARLLANYLRDVTIPKLVILGNHDFARGEQEAIKSLLKENGIYVLGDEDCEFGNVGFAGIKGFGGGFGDHMLGAFGEPTIKQFVQETINEAEQLEIALEGLRSVEKKVVIMHYAPISTTLIGESPEIFPFLGSTRLEEVIDRFDVSVVFHGHAHYGSPVGKTLKGVRVYNVAMPILMKQNPDRPYKIVEV